MGEKYKEKKRSCSMCKPWKMGWSDKKKPQERDLLENYVKIPKHKRKKKKYKLECKLKEKGTPPFEWFNDWTVHGKYVKLEDAEKAKKAISRNRGVWHRGDIYHYRIVPL